MSQPLIHISRKQALFFAASLVFFELLAYMSNDMIMPGMLKVTETFHADTSMVAKSLTAFLLGGASLQLFLGPFSDALGRRPVMIAGAVLFFMCTIVLGCSQSMSQFLMGRFFQGMGICFLVIGYAALQELFAEMDAVRLIALLANMTVLAPLMGPLAGASFILYFTWRDIYLVVAILAFAALYGLWRFMPETVGVPKREGEPIARVSLAPRVIARNYISLLTNTRLMMGAASVGLLNAPCLAWVGLSPLILMANGGLSMMQYALWQLPLFSACMLGNFFLRWLTHRFTLIRIIQLGSTVALSGLILMFILPYFFDTHFMFLLPGLALYGFGSGTTTGPLIRHLLFITPVSKGTTNALINTINMILLGSCTEIANLVYRNQSNLHFAGYTLMLGMLCFLLITQCTKTVASPAQEEELETASA